MDAPISRRRILAAGGVGAALSLAGCNSFGDQDLPGSGSGSSDATVTVFANVDQEALQSYQADLREQLESGEIDQQEAQTRAQQKKVELMQESVESFEERAAENDDLEVSDKAAQAGVLLAEGSAEAIVGTLGYEEVHGLLEGSEFEQYQQQAGQSGQGGASGQSGEGNQTGASGESSDSNETGETNATEESD